MATTNCDALLASDIQANCTNPIVKGVEREGILINRADINFASCVADTADAKHVIKTLALNSGKKGYAVLQPAKSPFDGAKTDLKEGAYINTFDSEVPFVLLDSGPETAKIVDDIANGEYVLILKNKHNTAASTAYPSGSVFQIYGYNVGLTASAIANDKWNDDTRNGWKITLKETGSPVSAMYLFNTDYETTETAVNTLLTAAT
jgi:hypothetical protein